MEHRYIREGRLNDAIERAKASQFINRQDRNYILLLAKIERTTFAADARALIHARFDRAAYALANGGTAL